MRRLLIAALAVLALGAAWVWGRPGGPGTARGRSAAVATEAGSAPVADLDEDRARQESGPGSNTTHHVLGYTLRTGADGSRCVLSYAGPALSGELALELPAPCRVVLDHRRAPQVFSYGQEDERTTVLAVAGGPPPSEGTVDAVLGVPCGTQVQGVLLRDGQVEASRRVFQGSTFCPGTGLDEKMFRLFSQEARESSPQ